MEESGARTRLSQSGLDIKAWQAAEPSVQAARPVCCPWCGAASRPVGGRIQLQGHGLRSRQVRGPSRAGGEPELVEVRCRRYRCVRCGTVVVVVPRGLRRRYLYPAAVIALGLALFGVARCSAAEVRRRLCPLRVTGAAVRGWRALQRWIRDAVAGHLWSGAPGAGQGPPRAQAESVARWLDAHGAPQGAALAVEQRVFAAALRLG